MLIKDNYFSRIDKVVFSTDEGYNFVEKLRVTEKNEFENEGLENLFKKLEPFVEKDSNENTILNITGGYKGVIPYLTIFAQLYGMPIKYIFEDATNLIEIPNLPIDFDFSVIDQNYIAFQSLIGKEEGNLPTSNSFKNDLCAFDSEEEFNYLIAKKIIYEDQGKIKLTILGSMLLKRYKELFNSGKFNKTNLLSKIVELRIFEYYVEKYRKKVTPILGKKVGDREFDIDVYIERGNCIEAIEVKSGGNPPILIRKENDKETIEYKLTKGGFAYLIKQLEKEKDEDKKILELVVILYSPNKIHHKNIEKIKSLHEKYPKATKYLKWYHARLKKNYTTDMNWKINNNNLSLISLKEMEN